MKTIVRLAPVLVLCAAGLFPSVARAQIPDEFTNLKLLPEATTRGEIIGIMRDWSGGLGVRCNHCHVGPDNLEGMDFASDEKATKRTARRMLEMSREINGRLLESLPVVGEGDRAQIVSCYTCHRGQPKPPRNIESQLSQTYSDAGIDGVIGEYRELRQQHLDAGQYDFRAATLNNIAGNLARAGRGDDALRLLAMNRELHPDDADVVANIGAVHLQAGALELAGASFEKALALDPANWLANRGMQELAKAEESPGEPDQE